MTSNQDTKIPVPLVEEPGAVWMTPLQWEGFKARLSEEAAWYWCERAEAYAEESPKKWKKYKSHYLTLLNWHQRKVECGYEFYAHPKHGPGYYRTWVIEQARRA